MGKQKTKKRKSPGRTSKARNRTRYRILIALAGVGVVVVAVLLISVGKKTGERGDKEKATSSAPPSVSESRMDLKRLVGRWLRPDGDYVLEIRSIRTNGRLDAGYFNPRPINVSLAKAAHKDDLVEVFVELQDVDYPGSTYTLTYDARSDALIGTYFQAVLGQTFDVIFVRMK